MIDVLLRSILTPQNIARIVNGVVVTFTALASVTFASV